MKKLNTSSNKVFTLFGASTSLFIFFQIDNLFKQFMKAFLKNIRTQAGFQEFLLKVKSLKT